MRAIHVIGIGTGGPEQLTLEAVRVLGELDAVFMLDKGSEKADLLALRREILQRHAPRCRVVEAEDVVRDEQIASYAERVDAWHDQRASMFERMFREGLGEHEQGGILVWGDPSLYDSTLRILERITARGELALDVRVLPGISSVQVLAARHCIALNRVGENVLITTGRKLAQHGMQGANDVVVMLDGSCSFQHVPGDDVTIYWGAYLGSDHELLLSGPLRSVEALIERTRAEARARHGWIMDIYLLRRLHTSQA